MIPASKILWGEGLFLRPQHFQMQDAYHEWRLAQWARALHPHAWGVQQLQVDTDALQTGLLRLITLQLVFPDGESLNAPSQDPLPPPLALDNALTSPANGGVERLVHLAMAPMRTPGCNMAASASEAGVAMRYHPHSAMVADAFTDATEGEVVTLRKSTVLLDDSLPRDNVLSLPLLKLRRNASGIWSLDERFVPPCLSLQASPFLGLQLRRLVDALQSRVDTLRGLHRQADTPLATLRSSDVASFSLMQIASAAVAALSHFAQNPGLHPERLFERLLHLAGSLQGLSTAQPTDPWPAYSHTQAGPAFVRLHRLILDGLDTTRSPSSQTIALSEVQPAVHQGGLPMDTLQQGGLLFLVVSAPCAPSVLMDWVSQRVKVGSPEDVSHMVRSALPGLPLQHAPQVPAGVPMRAGSLCFAIAPQGTLYTRMLQAHTVSLYVPSGLPDLRFELVAMAS